MSHVDKFRLGDLFLKAAILCMSSRHYRSDFVFGMGNVVANKERQKILKAPLRIDDYHCDVYLPSNDSTIDAVCLCLYGDRT